MRTAIVTGGGSGIGRATALRLAGREAGEEAGGGHVVALVGRTLAPLEAVVAEIKKDGGEAMAITADVSKSDQVEGMVRRVVEAWGRIDVLVNNAGVAPMAKIAELTDDQWHEILETNLSSAFYGTRAVWPIMLRQFEKRRQETSATRTDFATGGTIINISSKASKDPFPGLGAYGAAKVGVNMLTLATAREGYDVGIRVVCIAPSAVDTPMFKKVIGGQSIAADMMLQADDVAAMIADAVSGSLRYSSGDTIFIHSRPG